MKLKAVLLGAAILGCFIGNAQKKKIDFQEFDLDNGLHVILHQDKSTPIVAVTVLYHVGSKDEVPGRTGFAHFFEHLLFEGSEHIGRGEYMDIVSSNGGALNANTSNDRTFYYEILPSNQLELGLWMESERMLHAKIDTTGVETQREVVKEEKRQRIDNQPYMSFQKIMFENAMKGTAYEWVPIGSMEDLNSAQLGEFMAFYQKWYVPNNATLSIAGDFDIDEAKAMIKKYFSTIPKGAPVTHKKEEIPLRSARFEKTVEDNIQLPAVFMGYNMPGQNTEDAYALKMLTTLLSSGESSRLNKKLVDEDQIAMQVVAFPYSLENGGIFITLALTQDKTPQDLESAILAEIERVKTGEITAEEYEKVLNIVENQFVSSYSTMAGIAEGLADFHTYYGDANLVNKEIERYRKVTVADMKRVANKYLTKENSTVLYYVPKAEEAK